MRSTTLLALSLVALLALVLAYGIPVTRAQDGPTAQINAAAPLPVYVTNTPVLPDGFTAGSNWRFTTWTTPSQITWIGRVQRVSGPWALIQVTSENAATTTRWFYVAAMPGSWEKQ